MVKQVIHEIERQPPGEKTKSWEELCKNAAVEVTPVTLKRAVENAGYYKCPACQRGKRVWYTCFAVLLTKARIVSKMHGLGKD